MKHKNKSKTVGRKIRYSPTGYEYIEYSLATGRCIKVIYKDTMYKYLEDFAIGYERKENEMQALGAWHAEKEGAGYE